MSSMVRDFPLEANVLADGVMRAFASLDEGSVVVEPPGVARDDPGSISPGRPYRC
jgi:hypothetical protein